MVEQGKLAGTYNLVVADAYDRFDHQVPVSKFESMLRDGDVPDEVSVVGLADVYAAGEDEVRQLRREMDRAADGLETRSPMPTIEFAVDGSFQRLSNDFELQTGDDLYRLSRVFGPQIEREHTDWLTAPF